MAARSLEKALVVGYGSAGRRHGRTLESLGLAVSVVSRRPDAAPTVFASLEDGLTGADPDYVILCDETARHGESLRRLARSGFTGVVLVEKPLFHSAAPLGDLPFAGLYVAYQLRFHPVIAGLRERLAGQRAIAAQAYVGQHLADWRPDRPYSESYSASREGGGGALRDLSHEIDLVLWLFGTWSRLAALGGNHGALDIASDDAFAILLEAQSCPLVTLQLNYLDRPGRRNLVVNADGRTLEADLIAGVLREDGRVALEVPGDCDPTRIMHETLIGGDDRDLCDGPAGLAVLDVVAAAERAAAEQRWVQA